MKCEIEVHIPGYQCSYYLIVIYLRFLKTPQAIFQPEILGKSGNLRYFGTKLFEFTVDWLIFLDILKSKRKTLRASAPCISERWVWIEVKRRTHILASIQYHYFGTDLFRTVLSVISNDTALERLEAQLADWLCGIEDYYTEGLPTSSSQDGAKEHLWGGGALLPPTRKMLSQGLLDRPRDPRSVPGSEST